MTLIRKINPTYLFLFSLLLALILRIKFEINFPQLDSDYATETEAAKNFIEGHGFTQASANPENLSEITYSPLMLWPIGYAMALIPLYYISGSFIDAAVLLQCISVVILIFGFIKLFRVLAASQTAISLFLLFLAFTPTPFSYLGTTDLLTGALFLWAIAYSIEVSNSPKILWEKIISISLLLVLSCMLRFACIPNLVILPLFFACFAFFKKKYKLLIPAAIIFFISLTGTIIFFSIFKIDNGRTSFLTNLINLNLYFKHLLWFDSFPIKSLFFPRPFEFRLPHNLLIIRCFRIGLHLASLFFAGYLSMYFFKKIKNTNPSANKNILSFCFIFLIAALVICSFISLESLTSVPESNSFGPSWMPKMWTFVYSTRYFVIPILLFQVLFFLFVNDNIENEHKNKTAKIFAKFLYAAAMLASIFQWIYTTKQYHFGNGAGSFWNSGKSEITTFNLLNHSVEENPSAKIIYAYFNRVSYDGGSISLYSKAHVCRDYISMMNAGLKHDGPVLLYILMPNKELNEKELNFISIYKPEAVEKFEQGTLYKALLK